MRDVWVRGLLGVMAVALLGIFLRGGPGDAVSASPGTGEFHLVTMSDDSIMLVRRTGDRLDGLGELRQGKDKRRYIWTPGRTFESGRPSSK